MTPQMVPGILIRIDEVNALRLRDWVYETDWQIIVSSIEKRGAALVINRHPGKGEIALGTIREIPSQRGRFRPHYGDAGGGFEYCFRPQPDGVALTARCLVKDAGGQRLAPLELLLPGAVEFQIHDRYHTGITCVEDSHFVDGENRFGFSGKFFGIYRSWDWYSEDVIGFEFQFYPFSIGCMMRVLHIESNTLLDLTKDAEW